jgi:hypothetical protein
MMKGVGRATVSEDQVGELNQTQNGETKISLTVV